MKVYRGAGALRFLSGNACVGEINVRCPNCGSDYTHVRHVGTLVGTDSHEATTAYEGTVPTGTTSTAERRLGVVFDCENGPQVFALVIQQHKGNDVIEIYADVSNEEETRR